MVEDILEKWKSLGIEVKFIQDLTAEKFNPSAYKATGFCAGGLEKSEFAAAHALISLDWDKCRWLVLNQDKQSDYLNFPGGGRKKGETEMTTLKRELGEELSIEVGTEKLKRIGELELGNLVFPLYKMNLEDASVSDAILNPVDLSTRIIMVPVKNSLTIARGIPAIAKLFEYYGK